MKKMISLSQIQKSTLLALFMAISSIAQAQLLDQADYNDLNGAGQNNNQQNQVENGPDPGGDPGVPVDGGLGFLLAAGVGYGANKLRKYRQEKRIAEK